MGRQTLSSMEVVNVLVNAGGFEWRRTIGDHAERYHEHSTSEDDRGHVRVPLHGELRTGTLRDIAEIAGAHDFDAFCEWIDRKVYRRRKTLLLLPCSAFSTRLLRDSW